MNDYVLFQTRKEDQKRSRKDGLSKMETNKKTLRIGLLGFGAMGKTHLYAVRNLPFFYGDLSFDAEVVGVCTTSMEKSNRVAAQYHIPFATDDPNALIEREDIDVIDRCRELEAKILVEEFTQRALQLRIPCDTLIEMVKAQGIDTDRKEDGQ